MNLNQARRFYETLAVLIGSREGVKISVTVTPASGKEGHGEDENQSRKAYDGILECEQMQVS